VPGSSDRVLAGLAAVVLWLLTAAAFLITSWFPGTIPDRGDEEYPAMVAYSVVGALFTGLFFWSAVLCSGYTFEGRWPRGSLYVPLTGAVVVLVVLMDVAAMVGG
jgi:hypothetical protein